MPVKIAIIGAGSVGFTRRMVRDILCVPELQDTQFAFMDINEKSVAITFCNDSISSHKLKP